MKDPWGREIFWIGGRHDHLDRRGELRSPGGGGGVHLGHPAAHGSHQLLAARNGAGMVAGGVGEGDSYGGYREPAGGDAPGQGHARPRGAAGRADGAAAPLRARERAAPGLRRCGPADRQRADHLPALRAGPLPRADRRSPDGSRCSRSAPARGTRRRCSPCWRAWCSASSGSPRWPRARGPRWSAPGSATSPCWWATARWAGVRSRRTTRSWWRRPRPEIPAPLVEQLAPGGRMVIPLGDRASQTLTLVRARGRAAPHQHRRRRTLRAAAGRVRLPLNDARRSAWICCAASSTSSCTWTRT